MLWQLRTYRVKPGQMDEFVELFHEHLVPAREALGFTVVGSWRGESEPDEFVWIVGHEAPDGWEAIEGAYYASPERAAVPQDPKNFLTEVRTTLLRSTT